MTVNNDRVMFSLPSWMVTPISAVSEVFTTIGWEEYFQHLSFLTEVATELIH
jgi:hypothetical protein